MNYIPSTTVKFLFEKKLLFIFYMIRQMFGFIFENHDIFYLFCRKNDIGITETFSSKINICVLLCVLNFSIQAKKIN